MKRQNIKGFLKTLFLLTIVSFLLWAFIYFIVPVIQRTVVPYVLDRLQTSKPIVKPERAMSFRLKWIIYSSFAQHFVAKEKGFYKEEGLQVDIQAGGAGIDPIKLVVAGDDLVGLASPAQILLACEKNIPVIAIGEEYVRNGSVVMSLKESGIAKPQDLIGKRIEWIPGSDTGTMYEALMAKAGVDRSKITEVPGGFSLTPFLNKSVDATSIAFISNQPIQVREKGLEVNIIDPFDYGIKSGGNVFFTTKDKLEKNRDMIKAFLRASIKGIYVSQHMPDEEVVDIVMKYNPKLIKSTELKVWDATKKELLEKDPSKIGNLYKDKWMEDSELFHQYGGLKNPPPVENCYTNKLVEEIHQEDKLF